MVSGVCKAEMRTTLEQEDIQAIAEAVIEKLKPLLIGIKAKSEPDTIFTPETLAEYLQVNVSWVYKQVSFKAIPYFKSGKYVRFRKSVIDRWTENQSVRPIPPLRAVKIAK
jgi:excisionase family DNA binding protein